jgi:flagellin
MTSLVSEIDRISSTTTWAGTSLLDGSDADGFSFQVGSRTGAADSITAVIASTSSGALGIGAVSLGSITAVGAEPHASTAGAFVMAAEESNSITLGGKTFTAGVAVADGNNTSHTTQTASITSATNLTANTTAGASTFLVNGVTINYTSTTTSATNAGLMVTAFNAAKSTTAALSHVTATATIAAVAFTASAADIGTNILNQVEADSTVSSKFSVAGTATLTFAVKTDSSVTSVGTNTVGSGGTGGITATSGTGSFIVAAADATLETATVNNTINLTVDGVTVAYNTFTDGVEKGFGGESGTENAAGQATQHAAGIIQKFKDAGLTGVTFVNTAGTITASKGGQAVDISSASGASDAIVAIDSAIQTIGNQRAVLGATSNRLDSTVANLTNISTNLSAGRGRIEDADFAAETTNLAKSQILQQASTAMLAQANASKQGVLSLLQG